MPDAEYKPIESYYRTKGRYVWTDPVTGEQVESTMRPPMAEPELPPSAIADVTSQRGRVWTSPKALAPLSYADQEVRREYWPSGVLKYIGWESLAPSLESLWMTNPKAALDIQIKDDLKTKMTEIQNDYLEMIKPAEMLPADSPERMSLLQDAEEFKRYQKSQTMMLYSRIQNAQDITSKDQRLTDDERLEADMRFYTANPLVKARDLIEKPVFTQAHIQQALGRLATDTNIFDRESAVALASQLLGFDFAQKFPQAMEIINKRAEMDFAPIMPAGMPREELPVIPQPQRELPSWRDLIPIPAYQVYRGAKRLIKKEAPSVQMQSAPDVALDPYWKNIPEEIKPLIWRAFESGDTADDVINSLKKRGIIR